MGIRDGLYRLAIADDIKICASKDFSLLESKVNACFKYFDDFLSLKEEALIKSINSALEDIDLKFFFESVRYKRSSLEYQKLIAKSIQDCLSYNNKFLILFNFVMSIKDGR